jgi:hypothetical protein
MDRKNGQREKDRQATMPIKTYGERPMEIENLFEI